MKFSTLTRSAMLATLVAGMLHAPAAQAALPANAVACRAAIAKSYPKLVATAFKTIAACHKSRDKGTPALAAANCNDMTVADSSGKYAAAATKVADGVTAACTGVDSSLLDTDYYVSCPVTCAGVSNPMTSMAQVGKCLGCQAANIAKVAGDATLGSPTPSALTADDVKCRGAITKGYPKFVSAALKSLTACQGARDALGNYSTADCEGLSLSALDPKGKVQGALTKAGDGITASCAAAVLANIGSCSSASVGDLKSCNDTAWLEAADSAFTSNYELPATICPSAVRTTIRGACTTQDGPPGSCSSGNRTGTQLSVGWKGLAHAVDIVDSYTLAGDVTCPGTEKGTCGTCTINGISDDNPQYAAFTRCKDSPWTPCTNPFGSDAACGGGQCAYYLGPPLAISAGGTPTCTMNVVATDITGTVDPDAGTGAFTVDLRSVVHTGLSQARPCPICRNDTTPQDGVASGTCLGGPRNGQACDVQGFDLSFAPTNAATPTAGNSLDCPPAAAANISGSGLAITLPLTTGTSTKTAEDPCEAPNASKNCFCGVCSGDNTVSCNKDSDCSSAGLGSCGRGNGVDRKPNNCSDGVCTSVPGQTDRGECQADIDSYCSGVLFATGRGVIPCNSDADCDSYISGSSNPDDWVCQGNSCGTCTVASLRSCFLDPISLSGTPDTTNPILAGTFCLPPSSNGSVNSATGSPGPGAVQIDSIVQLRY